MKELSIEEKAKAYDEALERARMLNSGEDVPIEAGTTTCEYIFPELREVDDEEIRKTLISYFNTCAGDYYGELKLVDILAWLEKQNPNIDKANKEYWRGYREGKQEVLDKYAELEKQGENKLTELVEQNPIGNPEPKFQNGQWITNGDYTWKIVEVKLLDYILQSQDGNIVDDTISHVDEQFHLFTIKDAKDGDVLFMENASANCIFIYKSFNNGIINKYASYNNFGFEGEHYLVLNDGYVIPTTKEQRDILFQKMKESGYEWDVEKKELKKIEQKSAEWSEEDEKMCQETIDWFEKKCFPYALESENPARESIKWLKSLKTRVQPKQEWSEEDEKMLADACIMLDWYQGNNWWKAQHIKNWTKALKQRIGG